MSPCHLIVVTSSLAPDDVNRKTELELPQPQPQPVYTNAQARSVLDKVLEGANIRGTDLDLIPELQNSPQLKSLAFDYVEAAANFDRFKGMIELNMNRWEGLTDATGKLLAVMAELRKEERDLDSRLMKSVKQRRKLWIPGYAAVMIAPLLASVVLALVEMPQKVIYTTSALSGIFGGLKYWIDSRWDEREEELGRTRDAARTMRRLAFKTKDELEDVQALAQMMGEMETDMTRLVGKVNACAAGVDKAAVEFVKFMAKG